MRILIVSALAILMPGFVACPAAAQAPSALVEDVSGNSGVEFMDYVVPGKTLTLAAGDRLVLSYLKSCWLEKIVGGTVTVGADQSDVQNGKVERTKTPCEAAKMQLATDLASKSGGAVFRGRPAAAPTNPQFTLFGLSPVIELSPGSTVVIERIDQVGERYEIAGATAKLAKGRFYDFAAAKQALTANGVYRATAGTAQVVFKIAPDAAPGDAPLAGRLLRILQPS